MNNYISIMLDGKEENLSFTKSKYLVDNSLAIMIQCNAEYFGALTVCIAAPCASGNRQFIDANSSYIQEIAKVLEDKNLIKDTGITLQSGFVNYSLYEFSDEFLDKWCKSTEDQ